MVDYTHLKKLNQFVASLDVYSYPQILVSQTFLELLEFQESWNLIG